MRSAGTVSSTEDQSRWVSSNAVALVALAPVVFAAAKLIAFSGGDAALLSALVQTLNVPAVLIASTAPTLSWLLGFLLFVLVANRHLTPRAVHWYGTANPILRLAFLLWLLLAVFVTPWPTVALLIALPLSGWLFRWVSGWWDRRTGYVYADVVAVVATMIFTLLVTPSSWLPAEIVTFADERSETVYVAADSEGWATLISVETHELARVVSSEITSRRVCNESGARSLLSAVSGIKPQPSCDELLDAENEAA